MSDLDAHSAHGSSVPAEHEQIEIRVEPYEAEAEAKERLHAALVRHHAVRAHLGGASLQLVEFELLDKDADEQARFLL